MAILTMSRQYGSGSREIRRAVISALNYEYVDKQVILNEIRKSGDKWEQWANELDESRPGLWEKYDWSFQAFGAMIRSILLEHAVRDNVILTGRGANFLLQGMPHALRVRVTAPLEDRIKRVCVRESLNRENAKRIVETTDRERVNFVYALYGRKSDDPSYYDAIFDTSASSMNEISQIIITTLEQKDKFKNEAVERVLRLKALAAKVKAGLTVDPKLYVPVCNVEISAAGLILRGVARTRKQLQAIEEAARALAGETPVHSALRLRV